MRLSRNVQITQLSACWAYDADYYSMRYGKATKQSSKNLVFSVNFMLWHPVFSSFRLECIIKQLFDSVFVICKIFNVSVRVISLAFGSAGNSDLDIDNSAYHKNLIQ